MSIVDKIGCGFHRTGSNESNARISGSTRQGAAGFTGYAFVFCVMALVVMLAMVPASAAQSISAGVSGRITDSTGGVIADAEVQVKNVETGVTTTVKTNGVGLYNIASLNPGQYLISASKAGFKTVTVTELVLNVQDNVIRNFKMQVGSISETVTINGNGLNINTTDGSVGTVIDRQFVQNIPLNGRTLQSLWTLSPGVVTAVPANQNQAGVGVSGEIVVNGQRSEANYFTVDGVSANTGTQPGGFGQGAGYAGAVPGETALGTTQSLVSIDALQEFRATTSTYSAEYGRTPGGQFSLVTRSGANEWHGSAYEYLRNDVLDATDWFNNAQGFPKSKERQNDFGGTLGGPVRIPRLYNGKDKTFFFFSYEGLRLLQPQGVIQYWVPDQSLRQSAPAELQKALNAFPEPNGGLSGTGDGLAIFNQTTSDPSNIDSIAVRVDHNLSGRVKIFGRYTDSPSDSSRFNGSSKVINIFNTHAVTLGVTTLISGQQTNDLRFNLTQNDNISSIQLSNVNGAIPFDVTTLPGPNNGPFPASGSIQLCLYFFTPGFGCLNSSKQPTAQRQYNLVDVHSWTAGSHNAKVGVDYRRLATEAAPLIMQETYLYLDKDQVATNAPFLAVAASQGAAVGVSAKPIYQNLSAFLQDEWKVAPRFSLSLGVRWDVNPAPSNANGVPPYTVTQISDPATVKVAPAGTRLWKTTWNNFAPRLGAAYVLRQGTGQETVLRGGFGVFYDMGNTRGSEGFFGIGFGNANLFIAPDPTAFPLSSTQLNVPPPSVATPYTGRVIAFDPSLKLPYTFQWNVALEQALGQSQSITASYVGAAGRRLLTTHQTYPDSVGNPYFSPNDPLLVTRNQSTSDYDALQLQVRRKLSAGLQAIASYTWSHSIDEASINFLLADHLLRASSDFDVRHNFQAAVTYDVPGRYTNHVLAALLSYWGLDARISARSALPIDIIAPSNTYDPFTGASYSAHPDLIPGQPLYVRSLQSCPATASATNFEPPPGGRMINICAFAPPPPGVEGDAGRNVARGFDAVGVDLALRREFPIYERLRLQFRAEAFNVFNHPSFGSIDSQIGDGPDFFGRSNRTLSSSLGGRGLSPLYSGGGPRSLQVALKLSF